MSWQDLLSRFRGGRQDSRVDERRLQAAIERVVDEINPKLRAIGGYRKKLREPVTRTLVWCARLVATLPPSIELGSRSWRAHPALRAFFSSADDLRQVLAENREVREFFDQHPAPDQRCYALLTAVRSERTVLGSELRGELMRRDVKQLSVSFGDRRLVRPAASEAGLHRELEDRSFDVLVGYALERIAALVRVRDELAEQRSLIDMELRLKRVKRAGVETLFGKSAGKEDLEAQYRQTSTQLEQTQVRLNTLEDYIERIKDVLGEPERYLRVRTLSLRLNAMNIVVEASDPGGYDLQLLEVSLGDEYRRVLMPVWFTAAELPPQKDFLGGL